MTHSFVQRQPARTRQPRLHLAILLIVGLITGTLQSYLTVAQGPATTHRADALVLVNQSSGTYNDFPRYIRPYLDHFGIPYSVLNVATTPIPANIGDYALIVIGHNSLDPNGDLLDSTEQNLISAAVNAGSGLLNFDSDLADGLTPRYSFIQDIFGFGYGVSSNQTAVQMNTSPAIAAFVMAMQPTNASYTFLDATTPRHVTPGANTATLATLGSSPFIVAATHGQGRAIQWTNYGWLQTNVWGPVHGFDDLVWRGAVWAARKPFVLQGLPNFVTFRVDDSTGPYTWADIAANRGFKIWNGFFMDDQDAQDIADMRTLIQEHKMTASIHARSSGNWFYFDHVTGHAWSDTVMAQNWAAATTFHAVNNLPKSKFVVPHFYEFGSNSFAGLQAYGAEFVGTVQTINQTHIGDITLNGGPYCKFQLPCVPGQAPVYYADYLTVPGHPEFNNTFFNVLTEIRDNAGYEWYPSNNVPQTIDRGVKQLSRAFQGMNLATLFTHEYLIQPISLANWDTIVTGVRDGIASFNPTYVTMDYAAQYVRAMFTSNIASSIYDSGTGNLQTVFSGSSDLPTKFHVFYDQAGSIQTALVDVPIFSGSTSVSYNVLNPATPTPNVTNTPAATNTPTATATPADGSIRINVYDDANQAPVLATTTNGGDLNATDNQWTEFLFEPRGYPGVFAATDETPPLMRFYATVPNGTYTLTANLYRNNDIRYMWGYTSTSPQQFSYDVTSGVVGDFSEHVLGVVNVSNGVFEMFVNNADALNGSNPFYGWAWLRLIPGASLVPTATPGGPTATPTSLPTDTATPTPIPSQTPTPSPTPFDGSVRINVYEDAHQEPILATTTNGADLNVTDNQWTEFLFEPRGYPGVFAGTEENPPLMRFYGAVPNGTYTLAANLYRNNDLRYYWGYTSTNPQQFSYDMNTGTVGQFTEQVLDVVTVTNGMFEMYVNNGDPLTGSNPLYGWAWLRLIPVGSLATPTPSPTPANTATPSPTPINTATPSPTPINTATPSPTPADTATPSVTPIDTATPSATPINTATPSATPVDTATPSATPANTATPSATPVNTATPSLTPIATATNTSAAPTNTAIPPTSTPVPPTDTPFPTATALPATATATPIGLCANRGSITRTFWNNVTGGGVASLTSISTYPNQPDSVDTLTLFETGNNIGNNYGQRVYGYVCPPVTGGYAFWVAADNAAQLYLSTSSNPANKVLLVNLLNWAGPREWTKYAAQKSVTVTLQANTPYFIEGIHKESSGGDNFAVAWQGPTLGQQVISGPYLAPFNGPALNTPTPGPSPTPVNTPTPSPTATATHTPTPTNTATPSPTPTNTPTPVVGSGCTNTGGLPREFYDNVVGGGVADLLASPNYPLTPTTVTTVTLLEAPTNIGNNYGTRIRGYLCPNVTGVYTFWVAGDNAARLNLGTGATEASKRQIAYVLNWTSPREWDKYTIQRSASITLVAGQRYYIEVLHKESTGGDNVAVAWQGPGLTRDVIQGAYLAPYAGP